MRNYLQYVSLIFILWLIPAPSRAAEITNSVSASVDPVNSEAVLIQSIIDISGEIEAGDDKKLKENFVSSTETEYALIQKNNLKLYTKHNLFYISSGGGQISAAFDIVKVLKEIEASGPTMIAVKGTCASACTIILFSMGARFARLCDRIGVHRAAISGVERGETFSASTEIADYLMKSGVPWAVVKKMLLTSASNISWLTLEDMRLAHMSVLPGACKN
jgi:hypothetical protein